MVRHEELGTLPARYVQHKLHWALLYPTKEHKMFWFSTPA